MSRSARNLAGPRRAYAQQRGAALFLLLALVGVAAAGLLVTGLARLDLTGERRRFNAQVLQQAREALIAYAITYPESSGKPYVPGHLPCPDLGTGSEGVAASTCGGRGVSALGRLPWQTLGLPPLKDYDGHCLWYAVSGSFKTGTKPYLLNWDSTGQFAIRASSGSAWLAGPAPSDLATAVVFAPGPALAGQNRLASGSGECGQDSDPSHFLDRVVLADGSAVDNAFLNPAIDGVTLLAQPDAGRDANDQLAWLQPRDLFGTAQAPRGIARRGDFAAALYDPAYLRNGPSPALAQRIADCLASFAAGNAYRRLPWASPLALTGTAPNTFDNDAFKDAAGLLAGRVPFHVWLSHQATGKSNASPGLAACNGSASASCRLLRTDNCPAGWDRVAGSPTAANSPDGWWDKWKDHFFYAVAPDFQPAQAGNGTCAGNCLYVDGAGPYAALVIFAGRATAGQRRQTQAERNDPANYLGGTNAAALLNAQPGSAGFGRYSQASGNDRIVCIRRDLSLDLACTTP